MRKKLTAKTQELNPKLPQYSNSFSKCLIIKSDTQEILLKKGTVYILFNVCGESNFDTELVTKVVTDVVHDFYFQSESISPIQSMEKAIVETKDKVLQLSTDSLTSNPQSVNLNILAAILWGNVLYIIKFGTAKGFLMKEGVIAPLEMISEGNFSTSSKVVDEDEVLILATDSFEKSFPPNILLTSSIAEGDLDPDQSCLLMRLLIDTSFTQNEVIDFGLGDAVNKNVSRIRTEKITDLIKGIFLEIGSFSKRISGIFIALIKLIGSLVSKVIPRRKAVLLTRGITQISGGNGEKVRGWLFLGSISVVLALTVFFILRSTVFKNKPKANLVNTHITEDKKNEETVEKLPVEDKSKDVKYKVKRTSPEVFYDLKITDQQAEPTELEIVGDKIVVADRTSGKIYLSSLATPSFKAELNTYPGIKSINTLGNLLCFNDKEGYKTYDLKTSLVSSSYKVDGLSLTFPYAGFVYSISSDILSRNTEKDGKFAGVVWAQNPDFLNARSMSVAYSIYILKQNGGLVNYAGGTKTEFKVSGLEKPFLEPVKVIANNDFKYIYVADKGNKSIVVLDEKGALIKQYRYEDGAVWSDIRSISVSLDEKTLVILNSSKIYKISLEN